MTKTLSKQKNGQIEESSKTIISRIKKNYAEMKEVAERATYNLRVAIGRDLNKLQDTVKRGEWMPTLKEVGIKTTSAYQWMKIAKDQTFGSKKFRSVTEHLRHFNPDVALPRQSVDEQPIRNILAGVNSKVLLEREKSEKKESRLKKLVALELVEAGFRALSHKVHSDKGGSDDAMMRLDEVRKALKGAITRDEISL